jgi:hypothetical protein
MDKKADVWISAILYIGLGVILLSIILAVGIPTVNRIRDKNTAIDTENLMNELDNNIRTVYSEGTGSKRPFKFEIKKGALTISPNITSISWEFETSNLLSEPGVNIPKGNLILLTKDTGIKDKYISSFQINYSGVLNLIVDGSSTEFTGANNFIIINSGQSNNGLPTITITPL